MLDIMMYLRCELARFRSDERGSIAVESMIILPSLFWVYLAIFSTFHSYRTYSVNQKAAYTIGDMMSRESNAITPDYIEGARGLLAYLTSSQLADVAVRITVVRYDLANDIYDMDWTAVSGPISEVDSDIVETWDFKLPIMTNDERLIVVETFHEYEPPLQTGLEQQTVRNFVFTSPRYSPLVVWDS